jgi:hypothetical protein
MISFLSNLKITFTISTVISKRTSMKQFIEKKTSVVKIKNLMTLLSTSISSHQV